MSSRFSRPAKVGWGCKVSKGGREPSVPSKVRLVFEVRDVDLEMRRLIDHGIDVSAPLDNRAEGYREIRLHDPDGNSLTLFAWIDRAGARAQSRSRE